jgi:hypothetical protein
MMEEVIMNKKAISIAEMTKMIGSKNAPHLSISNLSGSLAELNDEFIPVAELTIHESGQKLFNSLYDNDAFCVESTNISEYQHCRNWNTADIIPISRLEYIREMGFIDDI